MKTIILAAGMGNRLQPYTNDIPKCMVKLQGKPILHWQVEVMESCGLHRRDMLLVGGYKADKITPKDISLTTNPSYATTNMVATLFCAREHMVPGEDLLISYGDIVYEPAVLKAVLAGQGDLVVAADIDWERLWSQRMDNPLDDAETFKVEDGHLVELGKKPQSRRDIDAQYIGLIMVPGSTVSRFVAAYDALDPGRTYDGKDLANMYMTSFIQELIDNGWNVHPAFFNGGWIEVDTADDLEFYESLKPIKPNLKVQV